MKKHSFINKAASLLCAAAMLLIGLLSAPVAQAVTIVPLSSAVREATGFTHKATVTYTDLTSASSTVSNHTVAIFPGSGVFAAGTVVGPVALNLVTGFTNSTANNTNLLLYIGAADVTNRFFSGIEVDGRNPAITYGSTNLTAVFNATNKLNATFRLTGAAVPTFSTMGQGEVEIYFRLFDLNRLESE